MMSCNKDEEPIAVSCISDQIVDSLVGIEGKVLPINEQWFIEVNDGTHTGRYFDCNFPEHLKIESSSLVFDTYVFAIPPNVRLMGTPISITKVY